MDFHQQAMTVLMIFFGSSNGKEVSKMEVIKLEVEELEERIAPSNANFPPGQFPSGNPAHAPGNSNPNEVPSNNPGHD
jgi:hypothetical protein